MHGGLLGGIIDTS